jgi:hypothetical protein
MLRELDQGAGRRRWMDKRDAFSVGADTRGLVDQANAGGSTALERGVEIVDGKAYVVNPLTALGEEFRDGRFGVIGLEQLDQGCSSRQSDDSGAVGVGEGHVWQIQDVSIEGHARVEALHSDTDVRDASTAAGRFLHASVAEGGLRRGALARR